jgi:molybdenum cofactor cytidylyltransferase
MRFGPIPLAEAEGAILAHSLRLQTSGGGKAPLFKKGRVLSAEDVAAIGAAGLGEVIAAKLEPTDLHEDVAARRLAEACAGPQLTVTAPFTGRCNLVAAGAGLLVIDAARVDRINRLDESITIATLPAFDVVEERQMAATVKVIPFAADAAALEAAVAIAGQGGTPLARVAPFVPSRVALVQTRVAGMKESILDRTVEVTRERVEATGSTLISDERCAHDDIALAASLRKVAALAPDIILIAGASAIVDRRDVLPAAIEAFGGTVLHFGMPVDPGNLLLLAEAPLSGASVPVLGLPGCARSPKLNGFDWVLQRLIARVPVGRADIMAMGVGGLLKEIASRPQPRDKAVEESESGARRAQHAPQIAGIVLAAGQSRRMGPQNKLLIVLDGTPMVRRVVETMAASKAAGITVVTGHQADDVMAALAGLGVTLRHNPDYAGGLSTSVRTGLAGLAASADGAVIQLGDMPQVRAETIDRLIAAFNPVEGRVICVPTFNGRRGNPILWGRRFFADLAQVSGDVGGRQIITDHPELVCEVPTDDPGILTDVDTPEALAALKQTA